MWADLGLFTVCFVLTWAYTYFLAGLLPNGWREDLEAGGSSRDWKELWRDSRVDAKDEACAFLYKQRWNLYCK